MDLHKSMIDTSASSSAPGQTSLTGAKERSLLPEYEHKQVEFYTSSTGATAAAKDSKQHQQQSKTLPRRGKSDYLSEYSDIVGHSDTGVGLSGASGVGATAVTSSAASFGGQMALFEEKNEFLWECDHPKPGILSSILDKVYYLLH